VARSRRQSKTEIIDFRGVDKEIRQRGRRVPEGEYVVKVTKADKGWKDNDKSNPPYYRWTFSILEPKKYKGVPLYGFITSMKQDALFNLRNLIYACSNGARNVAGKRVKFNPDRLIGSEILAIVQDEEYTDERTDRTRINSRPVDVRPLSDRDQDEEEEEDEEEENELDEEDEGEEEDEEDDEEEEDEEDDEDLDEVDVDEI
jgi:hypothetical protein